MGKMKGFSNRWTDLPDYILGVTREIWEDRGIATLDHYYSDDIIVRYAEGLSIGNQATKAGTLATLAEFPDRELLGEDVIWSGTPEEGFLSSHRLLTMGTHRGNGYFGPATGKRFVVRAIADCAAINDQINDEWLIRDTAGILRHLGLDEQTFARDVIAREGGPDQCKQPLTPDIDRTGPYTARGNDDPLGQELADLLGRIMAMDVSAIQKGYDRAVQTEHPGAVTVHSWNDTERLWMGLRAAFPSARFAIDHQIGRGDDPQMPPRAAVRWSLWGKHDGWGMFGQPTGAQVYVMGFTHAEFGPNGLRREWTLFDPVSIWKQIFMATGAADGC
jgi:hypothetical protein